MTHPISQRPVVVFASDVLPVDTQASSTVVFRHLKALERAGYDICVIGLDRTRDLSALPASWQRIFLPSRRPYYPPYRPHEPLRTIRWLLLDQIVKPELKGRQLHCVIGLLRGEYLVGYAAWLSKSLHLPLFFFYHDRGERLHHARNPAGAARLRRQNLAVLESPNLRRVWTVTPELCYNQPSVADKFRTVYPIAEPIPSDQPPVWRSEFGAGPVLAHTGSIYNEIIPALEMIATALRALGGRLLLWSHLAETAERLRDAHPGVVVYEGDICNNQERCRTLRAKASAFLVVYPSDVNDMPWSLDCFPSKFTQSVQMGLPGIVLAPPETAVAKWCLKNNWSLYGQSVDSDSVAPLLNKLLAPDSWNLAAADSRAAATGDFHPPTLEALVNQDVDAAPREAPVRPLTSAHQPSPIGSTNHR